MASITVDDKRTLISAFVLSKISGRLRSLRDKAHSHFYDVANEIYNDAAINEINGAVRTLTSNLEIARAATGVRGYNNPLLDNNFILNAVTGLRVDSDPFDIVSMVSLSRLDYEHRSPIEKGIRATFDELEPSEFSFGVPLLVISKAPEDDEDFCDLSDDTEPPELWDAKLIKHLSVTDCSTKKEYHRESKQIGKDAVDLFNSLWNLLKTSRTDTAIFNKVPQLQEFYEGQDDEGDLDNILARMK